jgi:alkylation response protein AidB-like acyl-CoA dehydrogenase
MDFELSSDQEALQEAARDLLDAQASATRVRSVVEAGAGFDPALWDAMVEQGWTALAVPEDLGGLGLGTVELAVLLEQVGAHVAPVPFLQHAVAIAGLVGGVRAGHDEIGSWIDRLVAGGHRATIAWRPVSARSLDGGWVLDGTPEPVVHAPEADLVVLPARIERGDIERGEIGRGDDAAGDLALFAVEVDPTARPAPEPAMDRTRRLGWLRLDQTPATLVGDGRAVESFCDLAATGYCAEMLGGAARALELTVEYARERHQFGQPIGSFQAVKHRCADMLVDVEGMRSVTYYAAWAIGADVESSVAASTAKAWCSDAAKRVHASALQVHGGIGFTWEHDLHLFLKRSQLDQVSFGDATHHRGRLADLLRGRVEAGQPVV